MTHFTPDEFVDLIEGALDVSRAAHLDDYDACRARAAEVRRALAAAKGVEALEPSPLFWEHFSARVRAAVAAEPQPPRRRVWLPSPIFALAGACAVALLVVTPLLFRSPATPVSQDATAGEAAVVDDWLDVAADDDSWDVVVALTAGLDWEDAAEAGLAIRPGSVDRALQALTTDERSAFARLLEEELSGPI